ncbi:MAG: ATP-binding protein [Planctomycetota bacterium]
MAETKLIISGPTETKEMVLDPKGTVLGRGSNCDVVLDDSGVSRMHARISQDSFGRWIVEDLDSQNGVFVEGRPVKAQAVLPNQKINIRPFTMSLRKDSDQQAATGTSIQSTISIIDTAVEEDIVSLRGDHASILSPALMQNLNGLNDCLLKLSSASELYSQACQCLAKMLDTLVAIVRLPCGPEPLPTTPDILAFHFGADDMSAAVERASFLHLSKRVLEKVRSTDAPVKASSGQASSHDIALTIVDEYKPHLVFAARVHEMGEAVDVLYIDILEGRSSKEMFDFVEVAARQINFAQKNLFLIELKKQEEALREANIQLREKDRIKDEYVSRVTHDIKGHLATIQSWLYVAAASGLEGEKQVDYLRRALDRTGQLTDFVKELLNLTQMRLSGRMQMQAFSLPDSISKSLASVENRAKEKSITVTSNVEPLVGQIVGNEFSINEMVTNLLFNAVKYTPESKTVHLNAAGYDDHVRIDISDTGIGIPADELANVFEEFFRASNAQKREKDGTGLGLSIVKQIVERHGGKICVESEEGCGSKFTVILPKDSSTPVCS